MWVFDSRFCPTTIGVIATARMALCTAGDWADFFSPDFWHVAAISNSPRLIGSAFKDNNFPYGGYGFAERAVTGPELLFKILSQLGSKCLW